MRLGLKPKLVFDTQGEIIAISTGSDYCAEHESGSAHLMRALCMYAAEESNVPGMQSDSEIIAKLKAGVAVIYPQLIERKTINHNLAKLQFESGTDDFGAVAAIFGYAPLGNTITINQLSSQQIGNVPREVIGAWDERSFAVKVTGVDLCAKLQRFVEKVMRGDGLFAGTIFSKIAMHLEGVCIAVQSALEPVHHQAIEAAQAQWEAEMRLKARAKVDELYAFCKGAEGMHRAMPGHIWPVWKNHLVDGDIAYALNPGYGVDAPYWGPYTFEMLRDWIMAEKKFPLTPITQ